MKKIRKFYRGTLAGIMGVSIMATSLDPQQLILASEMSGIENSDLSTNEYEVEVPNFYFDTKRITLAEENMDQKFFVGEVFSNVDTLPNGMYVNDKLIEDVEFEQHGGSFSISEGAFRKANLNEGANTLKFRYGDNYISDSTIELYYVTEGYHPSHVREGITCNIYGKNLEYATLLYKELEVFEHTELESIGTETGHTTNFVFDREAKTLIISNQGVRELNFEEGLTTLSLNFTDGRGLQGGSFCVNYQPNFVFPTYHEVIYDMKNGQQLSVILPEGYDYSNGLSSVKINDRLVSQDNQYFKKENNTLYIPLSGILEIMGIDPGTRFELFVTLPDEQNIRCRVTTIKTEDPEFYFDTKRITLVDENMDQKFFVGEVFSNVDTLPNGMYVNDKLIEDVEFEQHGGSFSISEGAFRKANLKEGLNTLKFRYGKDYTSDSTIELYYVTEGYYPSYVNGDTSINIYGEDLEDANLTYKGLEVFEYTILESIGTESGYTKDFVVNRVDKTLVINNKGVKELNLQEGLTALFLNFSDGCDLKLHVNYQPNYTPEVPTITPTPVTPVPVSPEPVTPAPAIPVPVIPTPVTPEVTPTPSEETEVPEEGKEVEEIPTITLVPLEEIESSVPVNLNDKKVAIPVILNEDTTISVKVNNKKVKAKNIKVTEDGLVLNTSVFGKDPTRVHTVNITITKNGKEVTKTVDLYNDENLESDMPTFRTSKVMYVGDTSKLNVGIEDVNGIKVSYSSSDSSIAKVSKNGNIQAVKEGIAEITASYTMKGMEFKHVTVAIVETEKKSKSKKELVQIEASANEVEIQFKKNLSVGNKLNIGAYGIDTNEYTIKYQSSNKKIATVSSTGVITGVKKGNVKITVTLTHKESDQEIKYVVDTKIIL